MGTTRVLYIYKFAVCFSPFAAEAAAAYTI